MNRGTAPEALIDGDTFTLVLRGFSRKEFKTAKRQLRQYAGVQVTANSIHQRTLTCAITHPSKSNREYFVRQIARRVINLIREQINVRQHGLQTQTA